MARVFYLSYVYSNDIYCRHDFIGFSSLQELDSYIIKFSGPEDIFDEFNFEANGRGKVHVVFEDTERKKEQLMKYEEANEEEKRKIESRFSYAHIIPVMYADRRLLNFQKCYRILQSALLNSGIIEAVMSNQNRNLGNGESVVLDTNKRYIFEGKECNLLTQRNKYRELMVMFLNRLLTETEDNQYFYCRTLMRMCKLYVDTKDKISIEGLWPLPPNRDFELSSKEQIEYDSGDMETFYKKWDLDQVINASDSGIPIGSEGKEKKL